MQIWLLHVQPGTTNTLSLPNLSGGSWRHFFPCAYMEHMVKNCLSENCQLLCYIEIYRIWHNVINFQSNILKYIIVIAIQVFSFIADQDLSGGMWLDNRLSSISWLASWSRTWKIESQQISQPICLQVFIISPLTLSRAYYCQEWKYTLVIVARSAHGQKCVYYK